MTGDDSARKPSENSYIPSMEVPMTNNPKTAEKKSGNDWLGLVYIIIGLWAAGDGVSGDAGALGITCACSCAVVTAATRTDENFGWRAGPRGGIADSWVVALVSWLAGDAPAGGRRRALGGSICPGGLDVIGDREETSRKPATGKSILSYRIEVYQALGIYRKNTSVYPWIVAWTGPGIRNGHIRRIGYSIAVNCAFLLTKFSADAGL